MIQERKDAGQDDYRKGKMKDKMDTAKERCRAGWIGKEGCSQDRMEAV